MALELVGVGGGGGRWEGDFLCDGSAPPLPALPGPPDLGRFMPLCHLAIVSPQMIPWSIHLIF